MSIYHTDTLIHSLTLMISVTMVSVLKYLMENNHLNMQLTM